MFLSVGTRLGPYEIVGALGAGGMGEVYRARDPRLGRDVAIKALPAAFAQDPERLARFEREARLLASLSHPNVAGIHGLEEVEGGRYLVLELVEGETLAARLARGPLPLDEALEVAKQIAAGVEAAHESGVVHRDLKPGNVMLTPSGAVKVLDFGLAKAGAAERTASGTDLAASPTVTHAATQAGVILGTAAYMSPEQARGRTVDKRSDVWAFGCVLYECLTGHQAYEGETVSDLIAKILRAEPDWSALPPDMPPRVRELLARCLHKDARERLRDIGEARIVLASPFEERTAAAPASRPGGLSWWAVAALALALVTLTVSAALRFGSSTAPAPLRKLDLSAGDIVVSWAEGPVLSPDGSRIAYLSRNRIWVRDLDRLAPRAVADVLSRTPIGWSPDSGSLAFVDGKKLWKVPVEGGRPIAICEIPGAGNIIGVTWSRSGTIAFSAWRGGMYRVPAGGGTAELLIDIDPATTIDFHSPSWLANGDLLYTTHWKSARDGKGQPLPHLSVFDGKRQIPVAGSFGGDDESPIVTSTGQLLFLRRGANSGIWSIPIDLERRRAEGTEVLVAPDAVWMSASEDGSLLYVEGSSSDAARELVWADRSGKVLEAVGPAHPGLADPALSPDGRRIAFSATDGNNQDVWVRDLSRGTETRITFGEQRESLPVWLASASRLAYVEQKGMEGRIVAANADGSGAQSEFAPAAGLGGSGGDLSVAADGTWAARIVDDRGQGRLRVAQVLPDGTLGPLRPVLKTQPEPDINDASVSPDGRLLAYVTNNPGQVDLFLTRFPSGEGKWQVGTEGGRAPRWARDGKELLFISGSGPTRRSMVSVNVDSSQEPPLGAMTRLFELGDGLDLSDARRFDVTADGSKFLFVRPAGGAADTLRRMVLVQNWRIEFERKGGR